MGDDRLKRRVVAPTQIHDHGVQKKGNYNGVTGYQTAHYNDLNTRRRRRTKQRGQSIWCQRKRSLSSVFDLAIAAASNCTIRILLSIPFVLSIALYFIFNNGASFNRRAGLRRKPLQVNTNFRLLFPTNPSGVIATPPRLKQSYTVDYGGLEIEHAGRKRRISDMEYLSESDFRHPDQDRDDDGNDGYFAFDDDEVRRIEGTMNGDATELHCRRTSNHRANHPNCNIVYEYDLLANHPRYLTAGTFRQVFSLEHMVLNEIEKIAMKYYYIGNNFGPEEYEFIRMDAAVAERLTRSKRIYDLYGFCGLSILSEFFPHGDAQDYVVPGDGYLSTIEQETLEVYNDIPNEEKLSLALQMAEAIADLHGDSLGVIVHQDVHIAQFLQNADKTALKLNDFNRAEFMLWDEENEEYCRYSEGVGGGNWRSPEEYFDRDLNEQCDVYSLGNNMYSLLTGLWVFYDVEHDDQVKDRVKDGEKPFIDPRFKDRSLAEAKLAEITDRCLASDPDDRPDVFEVVRFLRDALAQVREEGEMVNQ